MTSLEDTLQTVPKARGDVAAQRNCLRCSGVFWSEGFGQRICTRCKSSSTWRSSISEGPGQSRRRSVGRSS